MSQIKDIKEKRLIEIKGKLRINNDMRMRMTALDNSSSIFPLNPSMLDSKLNLN